MSDLRTLHDAFAELERRVDAAGMAPVVRPRRAVRLLPVLATVAAVAVLFAGVMWLVPANSGTPTAGPPTTAPSTSAARSPVPATPDELIARFRVVLGDTATFEATQQHTLDGSPPTSKNNTPPGSALAVPQTVNPNFPTSAMVSGTLTSAGVTGSFLLSIRPSSDSGPGTWCRHQSPDCVVSTLPDGSQLATETLQPSPGAVAHMACVKRLDGTMVLLKVSNQEDPSGAVVGTPGGQIYAPQSPLDLEQLKAIVTSGKW